MNWLLTLVSVRTCSYTSSLVFSSIISHPSSSFSYFLPFCLMLFQEISVFQTPITPPQSAFFFELNSSVINDQKYHTISMYQHFYRYPTHSQHNVLSYGTQISFQSFLRSDWFSKIEYASLVLTITFHCSDSFHRKDDKPYFASEILHFRLLWSRYLPEYLLKFASVTGASSPNAIFSLRKVEV